MPALSSNNRRQLLDLAVESIRTYLVSGSSPEFTTQDPALTQAVGCFVTLKKTGDLRGCIGTFERTVPLYQNIMRMAQAAAFQDFRFPSVEKSELDKISVEISVLGELKKIGSIEEIEIGKHGILVKLGNRSGTLLPQVAVEQQWNREQFVMCCAREKAGFSPREISQAEIYVYEVEKFSS